MPVAGLGKFLFHHVADQKDLASAKEIADDEGGKSRDKHHGDSADNTGNGQRKRYLEENLHTVGSQISGGVDHIYIDFGKRVINGKHHKWQEVIYHAQDNGVGCIDDI